MKEREKPCGSIDQFTVDGYLEIEKTEEEERQAILSSCVTFEANTAKLEVKYFPSLLFPKAFDILDLRFIKIVESTNVS